MPRIVDRDWRRTEKEDFALNVKSKIEMHGSATPIYANVNGDQIVVGWELKSMRN